MNKNLIALAGAVGAIAAAGGLMMAGILPNPFITSSSDFMEKAFSNTANAKTVKNEFQINVAVTGIPVTENPSSQLEEPVEVINGKLEGASQADQTDKASPKAQVNFSIDAGTEGFGVSGSGEVRVVNKITYIKFNSLPIFFEMAGLKGQWLKIDPEEIKKQLKTKESATTPTFSQEQYLQMAEELKNIVFNKGLFQVKKSLGTEKIKDQSSQHYLVALSKEAVKKLLPDLLQMFKKYMTPQEQEDFDKQLATTTESLPRAIDALWQKTGEITFDVWLADEKIKQIKIEKTLDLSEYPEVQKSIKQAKLDFMLNIIYLDYDKPIII